MPVHHCLSRLQPDPDLEHGLGPLLWFAPRGRWGRKRRAKKVRDEIEEDVLAVSGSAKQITEAIIAGKIRHVEVTA